MVEKLSFKNVFSSIKYFNLTCRGYYETSFKPVLYLVWMWDLIENLNDFFDSHYVHTEAESIIAHRKEKFGANSTKCRIYKAVKIAVVLSNREILPTYK